MLREFTQGETLQVSYLYFLNVLGHRLLKNVKFLVALTQKKMAPG